MKKISVGIFAQVDAGKTTLSEALLYETGELRSLGRVDHKTAFLDNHDLERSRGITIFSKQARFSTGNLEVTLLDTPGHVDFSPEAERTMQVLDYAILLISGTDGVQAHTETLWKLLRRYHIPTFIFFNKMDLPGAEVSKLLQDARKHLSPACAELTDLETIALCDDKLLEQFLETGEVSREAVASLIVHEKLFPCLFGAALHSEGVRELLDALEQYSLMPYYPEEFAAKVYKIARDAQGNRLAFLKITGGSLKVRTSLSYNLRGDEKAEEKVTQIRLYSGAGFRQTEEVFAGEICAALGLSRLQAGDCLGAAKESATPLLSPVMTYRINLPAGTDERVALPKLRQLEEEEPQLRIVWNERLREIHAQLMGQVQIEVLQSLIAERFDMDVTIDSGRVSYRESIVSTVEGVGHFEPLRHYAEVHLILEPLPRGSGLVFATKCSEDLLDRNWQRLILTHLTEKQHLGVLAGSPITDMKITLAAGRAHLKHTEGGDFRQATYRAVRQGLMQAESVLLEPYYRFRLAVPAPQIGRAISDIRLMGGSFDAPEEDGEMMVLCGTAPVAELQDYMSQVVAYTHGHGKLFCELAGYDLCHNSEKVLSEISYEAERDTDNPADSVFCSHGAGINIAWNEVFSHMHLESVLKKEAEATESIPTPRVRKQNLDLDEKELQKIIEREFGPEKRILYRPPAVSSTPHIDLPPPKKKYLIVDGYNMIFAWDVLREQAQSDLSGAREKLLDILSNYCGYSPCELVVVFDSYRVKGGLGSKTKHNNLRVVYTKENESADLYIEALVGQIGKNYTVRVATSDALIQLSALRSGVLRMSAQELLREVEDADDKISELIAKLRRDARRNSIEHNPLRKISKEDCT